MLRPPFKSIDLSSFDNSWYNPGRGRLVRAMWYFVNVVIMMNRLLPFSGLRRLALRMFGAKIGRSVVVKPGVNVKYPWNLEIGEGTWIGEGVWLDSLGKISIGHDVCISQGAYLCTGSHDWGKSSFDLIVKRIVVGEGAWIGAKAVVLPGVTVGSCSVIAAGSVLTRNSLAAMVWQGNPASAVRPRWSEGSGG